MMHFFAEKEVVNRLIFGLEKQKITGEEFLEIVKTKMLYLIIGDSFPSLNEGQFKLFLELLVKQRQQGNLSVPNTKGLPDYGYSFCALSAAEREMLSIVSKHFYKTGERLRVADLAGGHGLTSWKITVLGGHVTYVDKIKSVGMAAIENMRKAKPFLNGASLKEVCRRLRGLSI